MLDIKLLLNNSNKFLKLVKSRDLNIDLNILINFYKEYRNLNRYIEYLHFIKKKLSNKIYLYKIKNFYIHIKYLKYFIELLNKNIIIIKKKLNDLYFKINKLMLNIPNIINDKNINKKKDLLLYKWGVFNKKVNFKILDHLNFCKNYDFLNFKQAVLLSNKSYVVIKGLIANLYRAVSQFMINYHILYHNYNEVYVPYIVKLDTLYKSAQLPKFKNDIFYVYKKNKSFNKYALIPTSEVSLINLYQNKILNKKNLPIKLVSNTPCFRAENISYGNKNQGLIRLNQFDKIELIQLVHPKKSDFVLEEVSKHAEKILKLLKIPYRKILLSVNNMTFSSCKTYDIEFWSPASKKFIEVSSCSNTSDFQSRRINIKYYSKNKNKNMFIHIINGSGLAVGRTVVAIIENHQVEPGVLKIPKILVKYMNGIKYIKNF